MMKGPSPRNCRRETSLLVNVISLSLMLPYDHLHPLISPENNWTQMWSLPVPEFWQRFETLCRFPFLQPCQDVISSVDSCPGRTLMWGQALGQREREREEYSPLALRSPLTVSSSHLSMLTAIWSYYLSCRDRFMCDVLCTHWGCFVWSGGEVRAVPRQAREQGIQICWCCFGGGNGWEISAERERDMGNDKVPQPDTNQGT